MRKGLSPPMGFDAGMTYSPCGGSGDSCRLRPRSSQWCTPYRCPPWFLGPEGGVLFDYARASARWGKKSVKLRREAALEALYQLRHREPSRSGSVQYLVQSSQPRETDCREGCGPADLPESVARVAYLRETRS